MNTGIIAGAANSILARPAANSLWKMYADAVKTFMRTATHTKEQPGLLASPRTQKTSGGSGQVPLRLIPLLQAQHLHILLPVHRIPVIQTTTTPHPVLTRIMNLPAQVLVIFPGDA